MFLKSGFYSYPTTSFGTQKVTINHFLKLNSFPSQICDCICHRNYVTDEKILLIMDNIFLKKISTTYVKYNFIYADGLLYISGERKIRPWMVWSSKNHKPVSVNGISCKLSANCHIAISGNIVRDDWFVISAGTYIILSVSFKHILSISVLPSLPVFDGNCIILNGITVNFLNWTIIPCNIS